MLIFATNFYDISPDMFTSFFPLSVADTPWGYYGTLDYNFICTKGYSVSNSPTDFYINNNTGLLKSYTTSPTIDIVNSCRRALSIDVSRDLSTGRSFLTFFSPKTARFFNLKPSRKYIISFFFGSSSLVYYDFDKFKFDYSTTNCVPLNYSDASFSLFLFNSSFDSPFFSFYVDRTLGNVGSIMITPKCFGTLVSSFNSYTANIDPLCFNHIEFLLDTTGSHNSAGRVACRVNGSVVFDISGVNTTNPSLYSSNPNDPRSLLDSFSIATRSSTTSLSSRVTLDSTSFSDFVILNEEMSYMDSFIGPVEISTVKPGNVISNTGWGTFGSGEASSSISDDIVDQNYSSSYVETESTGAELIFRFVHNLDPEHHTLYTVFTKSVFSHVPANRSPSMAFTPAHILSGYPSTHERSKAFEINDFVFHSLHTFYPVVPILATPWTLDYFNNCALGFTVYDVVNYLYAPDAIDVSDYTDRS